MKWYVEQPEKIRSLSLPSIGYDWTLELNLNKLKQEIMEISDFRYVLHFTYLFENSDCVTSTGSAMYRHTVAFKVPISGYVYTVKWSTPPKTGVLKVEG